MKQEFDLNKFRLFYSNSQLERLQKFIHYNEVFEFRLACLHLGLPDTLDDDPHDFECVPSFLCHLLSAKRSDQFRRQCPEQYQHGPPISTVITEAIFNDVPQALRLQLNLHEDFPICVICTRERWKVRCTVALPDDPLHDMQLTATTAAQSRLRRR